MDPAFKAILEKYFLASQPTISRFNSLLDVDTAKQFQVINEILLDQVYSIEMPKHILIDLDSTNCQTYGKQYGSNYNFHYSAITARMDLECKDNTLKINLVNNSRFIFTNNIFMTYNKIIRFIDYFNTTNHDSYLQLYVIIHIFLIILL